MYNCGPTVYDFAHIGNLRSFLFADILRRYLEYRGYKVKQVMNITDVGHMLEDADTGEDKIERAALRAGKTPKQIAAFYTKSFFDDIKKLGILKAYKYPRATDHIKEMIEAIKVLIKNGYAYEKNGSVYYDLKKFKDYGKLSGNKMADLIIGSHVEVNEEKKNPYDFALWIHNSKHKMQWNSPWGKGYPGWHLECSAMAMKYLGKTLDIHTGGEDNKFPHHECEIAQSEGANGVKFANFWLHTKHLLVDGQKMSKSKGNFYTLNDLLKKGYSERAIRFLLTTTHYRNELNFTLQGIDAAKSALFRIDNFYTELNRKEFGKEKLPISLKKIEENFKEAMNDDLNTAKAMSIIFEFARLLNPILGRISAKDKKNILKLFDKFEKVFGFKLENLEAEDRKINKLLTARAFAKKRKDYKTADNIRERIEKMGYAVEDYTDGSAGIKKIG